MNQTGDKEVVLAVEDLAVTYETRRGDVRAVRNVSFDIRRGEALGLVGESGCGKSTVAMAVMGYLGVNARVDRGRALFLGQNILEKGEAELRALRGKEIAMVYQDPMTTLNPSLLIGDQLTEVLKVHEGMSEGKARQRCVDVLKKVSMPDPEAVMERYPHQISGGQQQRVIIAMALLCNPALLVMDEPTTALDVTVAAAVLDLIQELRSEFDSAILYISHNLGVVARVCDRVAVMYAGEVVERANVHDTFLRPYHPYTKNLLKCVPTLSSSKDGAQLYPIPGQVPMPNALPSGCVFGPRCAFAEEICHLTRPELQHPTSDRAVRCLHWEKVAGSEIAAPEQEHLEPIVPAAWDANKPLLSVSGLKTGYEQKAGWVKKAFGAKDLTVMAVDELTFKVMPGSIVGVVGESGCGKTTLAKTVAGLVAPTGGTLEFMGVDVSMVVEKRDHKVLREIQMVFQNPDSTLNPSQTIRQIISRPLLLSGVVPRSEVKREVSRLLSAVKLNDSYLERRPRQLSGGEKQRVAIARAFASRPELVVCDEPVSSLDVSVQSSVLNTLLKIQQMYGTSLIFISHDLSVVRYLCDYIMVMYLGKICEFGRAETIFHPPYHPYTEALLSAVPIADPEVEQEQIRLSGVVPSVINPPAGCRFNTRCPRRMSDALCGSKQPTGRMVDDEHVIYCHSTLERLRNLDAVIKQPRS